MSAGSATIPSDADVLCEQCGYTLNGLPEGGNCPECGTAVAFSTAAERRLPAWEREGRFWHTTGRVIFHTGDFYRTLRTRVPAEQQRKAYIFAVWHWLLTGFLIALASGLHYSLTQGAGLPGAWEARIALSFLWIVLVTALAGLAVMGLTHLATRLTAWEAGWRGYRLPRPVVLRGLCYHAAHLLPVAIAILAVVVANRLLWAWGMTSYAGLVTYLVVLSGACVLGAIYLFWTYWIGMRNMLYANV